MTQHIPENISTWLVDWSLVAITDNTWPPRDPNHDDDEDEEDEEQIEPIASMRVWIDSGKEDWRRPFRVRTSERCRTRSPTAGFCFKRLFTGATACAG
jgi:hypothetical protein